MNIASDLGLSGAINKVPYVATKHGVVGMTKVRVGGEEGREGGREGIWREGERGGKGGGRVVCMFNVNLFMNSFAGCCLGSCW